jgi:hypothetical protein
VRADNLACSSGQRIVRYDDSFFAVARRHDLRGPGTLDKDELYLKMIRTCRAAERLIVGLDGLAGYSACFGIAPPSPGIETRRDRAHRAPSTIQVLQKEWHVRPARFVIALALVASAPRRRRAGQRPKPIPDSGVRAPSGPGDHDADRPAPP